MFRHTKKDILIIPVTVTLPPLPDHTSVISIGLANANAPTASDDFCTRTTTIPDINTTISPEIKRTA